MLLLVEDRGRPERPERPARRPRRLRLPWAPFPPLVAIVALLLVSGALPPLAGAGAALGALGCAFWLAARLTGSWTGLRDHRQ